MPVSSEKLLERMEKSHQDLIERIDRLDEQITEILRNWNELPPTDPSFSESSETDRLVTTSKREKTHLTEETKDRR